MKRNWMIVAALVVMAGSAVGQSGPQQSFDIMKSLAGNWEGKSEKGKIEVSYRSTAGGSALMGEIVAGMKGESEDMISMIHLDGNRLLLTHYCAAGNQPRMQGTVSADGKTITFDFVDGTNISGSKPGHMQRVVFQFIDANHHSEEWHFAMPGKEMVEKFDLQRKS
jgi:hypothetical protein